MFDPQEGHRIAAYVVPYLRTILLRNILSINVMIDRKHSSPHISFVLLNTAESQNPRVLCFHKVGDALSIPKTRRIRIITIRKHGWLMSLDRDCQK